MNKIYIADHKSNGLRKLSIRESLDLFGFPNNYKYNNLKINELYDLIGNTVVVPVIKELSLSLLRSFKNN